MKSSVIAIALSLVAAPWLVGLFEPVRQQIHRTKSRSAYPRHMEHDLVHKMQRRLAWALGTATIVLVVNAVIVVALVEAG